MKKILILGVTFVFLGLMTTYSYGHKDEKNIILDIQSKDTFKTPVITTPMMAPQAIAQVNNNKKIIKASVYQLVRFDAGSSYDPDGNDLNLSYLWTDTNSHKVNNEKTFVRKYDQKGLYEITLTVKDEQNLTTVDKVCVLVGIDESSAEAMENCG